MRSLSDNFQRAANAQSSGEVMLLLVTAWNPITDPTKAAALRFVYDHKALVSRGLTFNPISLDIGRPVDSPVDAPQTQFLIDNVDQVAGDFIDSCTSPPMVLCEVVLKSAPDSVEESFSFMLNEAKYNVSQVSSTLDAEKLSREPFPGDTITPLTDQGVF